MTIALVGARDRQLEELLRASGVAPLIFERANLPALASPEARQPDVIVLDIRDGSGIHPAVATIRRQHPSTGVVIVASTLDPAMLLEAMRAGVNELVSDPITQDDLGRAIARVIEQRPAMITGKIFGFVGAKGGVGTTTVAVNVAIALGATSEPER